MASMISDEIVDHIFSFIDEPDGLFALILTSKHFRAMAQPHRQYRVIRCTLGMTDLWSHLIEKPILAQHVRTLEIQRQQLHMDPNTDKPIIPKEFLSQTRDLINRRDYDVLPKTDVPRLRAAEQTFIRAINNMTNLKVFRWKRCPPVLDSKLDKEVHDDVWTVLATACPSLEHLDVVDASERGDLAYIRPVHHSAIWKLPQDLKTFRYHSYAYLNLAQRPPVNELTAMLQRCPSLEVLSVAFNLYNVEETDDGKDVSSAELNDLLANVHWPKLRDFRAVNVHVSPLTAARFFKFHPTIASLEIWHSTEISQFIKDETFDPSIEPVPLPYLTLLPGSLPNLKKLLVPEYVEQAIRRARLVA